MACPARTAPYSQSVCTVQHHDAIKADALRWDGETKPIGYLQAGGKPALDLRNCLRCQSTLAKKVEARP